MRLRLTRIIVIALTVLITASVGALATGRVAYVTTSGVSMEPTYSAGDFVVVVPADSYAVGDKVAYRDPGSESTVLHRIVDGDGDGGFRLKGDNNESVDLHKPVTDEVMGRAVVHVPAVGAALGSPITRGVLLVVVAGLFGSLLLARRTATTKSASIAVPRRLRPGHRRRSAARTAWIGMLGVDLVAVVVLGALMVRAATDAADDAPPDTFEQTIDLSYYAGVPVSETYPDGRIQTGDTVFRELVDEVDVSFETYSDAPGDQVSGWAQLDIIVSSSAGWERTLPLIARTSFDEGAAEVTGILDVARMQALADRIATETKTNTGTLDIQARAVGEVTLDGGDPVEIGVALPFRLTPQSLTLSDVPLTDSDGGPGVASVIELPPAAGIDDGSAATSTDGRRVALVVLLLALGITAVLWPTRDDGEEAPAAPARIRTTNVDRSNSQPGVELFDRAELEQIAREGASPILYRDDGWEGVFAAGVLFWTRPSTDKGRVPDGNHIQ